MKWRVAKSLDVLLAQLNQAHPRRDKSADGSIGDAAHSSRSSDHNPNPLGVVCARDFTNDPQHGLVSNDLALSLIASRDKRIKYIISNSKIYAGASGPSPWKPRPYRGANAHAHHCHVSVVGTPALYDDTAPWDIGLGEPGEAPVPPKPAPPEPEPAGDPVLAIRKNGARSSGAAVKTLQSLLIARGFPVTIDGDYGPNTKFAVMAFQKEHGLGRDGVVGQKTWNTLRKKS